MNILDIAENSVNARAKSVSILLDYRPDSKLILVIEDDGKGMDQNTIDMVTDPFFTSRTSRKVGLGIPFLKMAAEMTGGNFRIKSEPGKGTVVKTEFWYEHIDMMPLGDIGSTMSALISGNPATDFLFRLRNKGNEFTLDSKEIKKILGGLSVETAEVAVFIREYTTEHVQNVLNNNLKNT